MDNPLHIHRLLLRAGLAGVYVFAWLCMFEFVYTLTHSFSFALQMVSYGYALTHITVILVTPYTSQIVRNGAVRAIVLAVLMLALGFMTLSTVFSGKWGAISGLGFAIATVWFGFFRALYWVPYTVERLHDRDSAELHSTTYRELLLALLPTLTGFLLVRGMMPASLMLLGACIVLAAVLPLYISYEWYEKYSWDGTQTLMRLFSRRSLWLTVPSFLEGIEHAALLLLWPIVLILLVGGSHFLLGLLLSITLLISLILKVPKATHYISHVLATDGHRYIDEYSALREMSESMGRVAFIMTVAWISMVLPFAESLFVGFLIAAFVAAIRSTRITRRITRASSKY